MVYLILTEYGPEALEIDDHLPRDGKPDSVGGLLLGVLFMVPLATL